jgi:aryl-alcohol dehydrogenase-like predicted oxidoreductase
VLGTKFFWNLHVGDPNGGGAGRKAVIAQVEQSLRRLQTDYLDLLWLHNWDRFTPLEETLRVLDDLVRDGKVRYLGFSDVPAWVASEAQTIARSRGWSPITAFQLEYSLLARTVEGEHLPMCNAHGIGVMPWSPLKNGRLSGKYRRDDPGPRRRSNAAGVPDAEWPTIEELCAVADELGASPAAMAIAWVQQRPGVTSTLIGAAPWTNCSPTLGALDITFAPQQLDRLAAVSAPTLDFPAMYAGYTGTAQFAGATVDGQAHDVNPPLLTSTTRC